MKHGWDYDTDRGVFEMYQTHVKDFLVKIKKQLVNGMKFHGFREIWIFLEIWRHWYIEFSPFVIII
jgi:hypothetical protein